ncbi:lipocalin family protein [Caballeronia sp. LjRoot34]|uniref:lipocalin family protein n=1 Tax=Caballeronia sp. LjRoot34 TaxID=3342325 RepID=UPI003ECDF2C6
MRRVVHAVGVPLLLAIAACAGAPPNPNPRANDSLVAVSIDLPRYMGRWYVIGNIPYLGDQDYVGTYVQWALRSDGKIMDAFVGRRYGFDQPVTGSFFIDTIVPSTRNGEWRVCFSWLACVTRLTLYVDESYQYTIVGLPDKSLGWIMARDTQVSDEMYAALLLRLAALGFDVSRFRRVPQQLDQIGKPAFQSPGKPE